jgi:hypothetical protein
VRAALHIPPGKPNRQSAIEATDSLTTPGRLFVLDRASRQLFLVDTGSDLSVYPHLLLSKRPTTNYELFAANGSVIHTYGWHTISLNIGLRRDFTWRFLVADVTNQSSG